MTRGNQREIDRQRAANRHAKSGTGDTRAGDAQSRREADAKALAEKVAKKKELEGKIAAGEVDAAALNARGHGGGAKKKDGTKK